MKGAFWCPVNAASHSLRCALSAAAGPSPQTARASSRLSGRDSAVRPPTTDKSCRTAGSSIDGVYAAGYYCQEVAAWVLLRLLSRRSHWMQDPRRTPVGSLSQSAAWAACSNSCAARPPQPMPLTARPSPVPALSRTTRRRGAAPHSIAIGLLLRCPGGGRPRSQAAQQPMSQPLLLDAARPIARVPAVTRRRPQGEVTMDWSIMAYVAVAVAPHVCDRRPRSAGVVGVQQRRHSRAAAAADYCREAPRKRRRVWPRRASAASS